MVPSSSPPRAERPAHLAAWRAARATLDAHRAFAVTAFVAATAFTWIVTCGSWRPAFPDVFGDFYDFQARSLLEGRLDVPPEAIGDEAFIYAGKTYSYFGVTPALLRLPFVLFGVGFGELTRASMIIGYVGALVAAYLLLVEACRRLRPDEPRPSAWAAILLTANVGLGSTMFFLGSRAYLYHEAILWGVSLALFACWCALRHLAAPAGHWWLGALACGVLSVHARPPTGLFALTFLGGVALALAWRAWRAQLRAHRPVVLGALCVAGVLSFNALGYLKFGAWDGCPLRLNVQYDAARLAHVNGKPFHLSNLRFTIYTYVLRPNLGVQRNFPWLFLNRSKPGGNFPEAKMDFADRTLAIPYSMTGLFLLATAGGALAWRRVPAARLPLALTWLTAVPMALAMFTAIATTQRYTGDFCPFLVCAAAFGLAGLELVAPPWRTLYRGVALAATVWSLALTAAITLHNQGEMIWGIPDGVQENYRNLRHRVDDFFGQPHRP